MKIFSNAGGIADTNCFLIADETLKKAALFDAPNDTIAPAIDEAIKNGWEIERLCLTHGHFDHIADHFVLTQQFPNAKVMIHRDDQDKLLDPMPPYFRLPFVIPPKKADEIVEDGHLFNIGSLQVRVIHVPGHSKGSAVYYFEKEGILVGGDLIICSAVGRTDLPDGSYATLKKSVRKVMKLPPATRLLPGHGVPTTLDYELQTNLYVQEACQE